LSVREGKQIHLAAHLPEGDARLALVAQQGVFDFLVVDLAPFTVLSALAAVTDRIGLVATVDPTSHEPFETARQFATLDHLSGGRAGWNLVTATDRGAEFLTVARGFWDSWAPDAVLADLEQGIYADPDLIRPVDHHGSHFDIHGLATLPAGPQGHPVLLHEGDTDDGLEFAAECADVIVTAHRDYADVKARVAMHGRNANQVKVFHAVTAEELATRLKSDVEADGFLLSPPGLDDFVDQVVPVLQERGVFRTAYGGQTLRENLGLRSA
jgi:alkanesulfonate monooxygenase SsuD/methylene tetrahydromethanopterin reductase-like flavin-dependent oxidoreductase (luciferase family)